MRTPTFSQPVSRGKKLGPEYNPWFWNPRRQPTQRPPEAFMKRLKEVDSALEVTWNPISARWQVWTPNPKMNHPICQGWRLLFVHNGANGEYLPLDERVFARLYWSSADAWGSARQYFDHMQSVMAEDKAKRDAAVSADGAYRGQDYLNYTKVKNIGQGNKFTRFL